MPKLTIQQRFELIYNAAKSKDIDVIQDLLSEGFSLDERSFNDRFTASHKLAKEGDIDSANFLIQHGGKKEPVVGGLAVGRHYALMQKFIDENPLLTRSLVGNALYHLGVAGNDKLIQKYIEQYPEYRLIITASAAAGFAAGNQVNLLITFLNEMVSHEKLTPFSLIRGFAKCNNTDEVDKYLKNNSKDVNNILYAVEGYVDGQQLAKALACSNHPIITESKLNPTAKTALQAQITITIAKRLAGLGDITNLEQILNQIPEPTEALLQAVYRGFLEGHHLEEADEWHAKYSTEEKRLIPYKELSNYLAVAGCFQKLNVFLAEVTNALIETGDHNLEGLLKHSVYNAAHMFAAKSDIENLNLLFNGTQGFDEEALLTIKQNAAAGYGQSGNVKKIMLCDLRTEGLNVALGSFTSGLFNDPISALYMLTFMNDNTFRQGFADEMKKCQAIKNANYVNRDLDFTILARRANQIEKVMRNYQLNFNQGMAWTDPTFLFFVWQFDQLIENKKCSFDTFFKIASYLSPLTCADLKTLMPVRNTKAGILNRETLSKVTSHYKIAEQNQKRNTMLNKIAEQNQKRNTMLNKIAEQNQKRNTMLKILGGSAAVLTGVGLFATYYCRSQSKSTNTPSAGPKTR